jgi:Fe2+ or Zn2+ uptake regulation protein
LKKYVSILKDNNLKVTPQRISILKYLDEHKNHPTVDQIYSKLKIWTPSLSKTTVYNALQALERYGVITAITISGSEMRYDFNNKMHHHFLCKHCGRIIDIDIKCPNIDKITANGYIINELHGYFKGICKDCTKKMGR